METENNTPYAVEALPQQGPDEKTALTVIVKGTFDMRSGEAAQVSPEQIPVGFGDEPYDTEDGGSVKFESDAAPFKPRADIALVGRAYAPGGRTVNEVDVSLRVGHLKKRLRVIGDRRWKCLGRLLPVTMTRARPFKDMPIVYERAFGGIDTIGGGFCRENLVGRGFVTKKRKKIIDGALLPNIENPENLIKSWKDRPGPVGFGFYGRAWHPRGQYIGTYDENWRKQRSPKPPLDFSFEYHNGAHPDLQVRGYLAGKEEVELVNLTPDGYIRFWLPGVGVRCTATKRFDFSAPRLEEKNIDGGNDETSRAHPEPVEMNLDTLCLIPDENRLYTVWRGLCPVNDLTGIEVTKITLTQAPI